MSEIAFFSVIYPGVMPFLDDFFKSLSLQSFKNFDTVIVNDGFKGLDGFISKYHDLNIKVVNFKGSIPKIREQGIKYLKDNNYEAIVFGDSDDFFRKNRIEKSIELLKQYDLVVNDLDIVKEDDVIFKNYFSCRCANFQEIDYDFILDKNIFGFTNTAIKTNLIRDFELNENIKAVDWVFFSKLLHDGVKAVFTNDTTTSYRQHESNIAGINKVSSNNIIPFLNIKINHYLEMKKIDSKYEDLFQSYKDSLNEIIDNDENFNAYLSILKSQEPDNPLWWENIKSLKELK